ncbi:MAG: HD domain-containing protein [Candidatus Lokiarchaeota archaeon]|nr:HD domain-containing protein [Candidatus Lokiarchaeota archaeon]
MKEGLIKGLEDLIFECGGEYGLNHSKRLISLIDLIAAGKSYNKDVILFCAYTHDLGAFKKYAKEGMDHATRSREMVETLLGNYDFMEEDKLTILEVIEDHHKKITGKFFESLLFRDADALDFLGFIGISRDFSRAPHDLKKGFQSIIRHRNDLAKIVELDTAKKIVKERILEMDNFIDNFEKESMKLY